MATSRHPRRGIYLLPTVFTVGNLFCGYASIVHAMRGYLELAALLVVLAAVLDGLDGRIARLSGTTSAFGREFDSLADIVSFGVAPALLAYRWTLEPLARVGWAVGFLFVVCAAMRLARFNIRSSQEDRRHFAGLPSPMAAAVPACAVFAFPEPPTASWVALSAALLVVTCALLMVSRFRYRSFKEIDLRNRRSYIYVLPLAAIVVAIVTRPKWAMLALSCGYLLSAPLAYLWGAVWRRSRRRAPATDSEVVDEPAYR